MYCTEVQIRDVHGTAREYDRCGFHNENIELGREESEGNSRYLLMVYIN